MVSWHITSGIEENEKSPNEPKEEANSEQTLSEASSDDDIPFHQPSALHGENTGDKRRILMDQMFKVVIRGFRRFYRKLYIKFSNFVSIGISD
jgi:hypothetical protein